MRGGRGNLKNVFDAYEAAATIYRGDFAQGSYEPWVDEQRTYYKEQYLRLLEALAGVAQKQEEWTRSLQLAQQILHEDPFQGRYSLSDHESPR